MSDSLDPTTLFILLIVFVVCLMMGYGAWWYMNAQDEKREDEIRARLGIERKRSDQDIADDVAATLIKEETADQALDRLGQVGEQLQVLIKAAHKEMSVSELMIQCGVAAAAGVGAGLYLLGTPGVIGVAAGMLPITLLRRAAKTRATEMLSQLPDALELMARSMQAGAGLSDTFALVGEEMGNPVAEEFAQVADELRFGMEWRDALSNLIDRNPQLFDLRLFTSALLLQRDTGGNTIETLAQLSKTMRERTVFDAKVAAMTSEARTSGYVLAGMPIALLALIFLIRRDYLTPMFESPTGKTLMFMAGLWYAMGLYTTNKVTKVEV